MKPLDKSALADSQRRLHERLSEMEEAYRQDVKKRLQEAGNRSRQSLKYLKELDRQNDGRTSSLYKRQNRRHRDEPDTD